MKSQLGSQAVLTGRAIDPDPNERCVTTKHPCLQQLSQHWQMARGGRDHTIAARATVSRTGDRREGWGKPRRSARARSTLSSLLRKAHPKAGQDRHMLSRSLRPREESLHLSAVIGPNDARTRASEQCQAISCRRGPEWLAGAQLRLARSSCPPQKSLVSVCFRLASFTSKRKMQKPTSKRAAASWAAR
jgi:hypothetical protein